MTETVPLDGYFRATHQVKPGEKIFVDYSCFTGGLRAILKYFCLPPCSPTCLSTLKNMTKQQGSTPVHLQDARRKQVQAGLSLRDFFDTYGFVLVQLPTQMTAEDWLYNSAVPSAEPQPTAAPDAAEEGKRSPVREIYAKEIEPLIRELMPSAGEIHYLRKALRRGPGGPNQFYGLGVHQDYGLYPADMTTTYDSQLGSFEQFVERLQDPGTAGYCIVNFWRPVLPMKGPVRDCPLAVCDPNSVKVEEVVTQEIHGFVPGGQTSLGLKFSADHQWYYYPDMTTDEVLVLKQFQYDRGVEAPYSRIRTAFHSAFRPPKATGKEEARCSSEYRVHVWLK